MAVSVTSTPPSVIGQPGSDPGSRGGSDDQRRGHGHSHRLGVTAATGGWRSWRLPVFSIRSLADGLVERLVEPSGLDLDLRMRRCFTVHLVHRMAGLCALPRPRSVLFDGPVPPGRHRPVVEHQLVAIGIILAPVTWLFGPVASLNVALALAPVLSALFTFVLIRRWVSWMPAAFVGGLFYGFSPFIIVNLTNAYLMTAMAAIPPLILLCLDDLLFRQRPRPAVIGIVLGLLVALQFFIGTEALIIMAIVALLGTAVAVVARVGAGRFDRPRLHRVTVGLASGSIAAAALLIYPAWFALAGPAHLSGPIWPGRNLGKYGVVLKNLVIPTRNTSEYVRLAARVGGYQGPWLSPDYLGIGAIVVVVGGLVLWRRDRRLWFFAAMSAASFILALGTRQDLVLPWQLVAGLPLLHDVIPGRFLIVSLICLSVMIALIVDHAYRAAVARTKTGPDPFQLGGWAGRGGCGHRCPRPDRPLPRRHRSDATQPSSSRLVRDRAAAKLSTRPVVLAFPVPYSGIESAMTWQAVSRMRFDMVGGEAPRESSPATGSSEQAKSCSAMRPTRRSTPLPCTSRTASPPCAGRCSSGG